MVNDLNILVLPSQQNLSSNIEPATFALSYDWDVHVLDKNEATYLKDQLVLCTGFLPCKLSIFAQSSAILHIADNGSIICSLKVGCDTIWLSSLKLICLNASQYPVLNMEGSLLSIVNSNFSNCSSNDYGGLIKSFNNATVIVHCSVFTNISSSSYGGVISAVGSRVSVFDSIFSNCRSAQGGGAIWAAQYQCFGSSGTQDTKIEIKGTSFDSCRSDASGGALLTNGKLVLLKCDDSEFKACQASSGGAVYVSDLSTLELTNTTFLENIAHALGGGAIHMNNAFLSVPNVSNAGFNKTCNFLEANLTFIGNRAPAGGGGILFWQGLPLDCTDPGRYCNNLTSNKLNFASYGFCVASDFNQLMVEKAGGLSYPGIEFQIFISKKDFYFQTITSDSFSILQAYTSFNGTFNNDPDSLILGASAAQFKDGSAEFLISIQPAYSVISFYLGIAKVQRTPFVYFEGSDSQSGQGNIMRSMSFPIDFDSGRNVCPPGYILSPELLGGQSLQGRCKFCNPGTYSVDPLAPNYLPGSNVSKAGSQMPSCLNCPLGGNCIHGGNIVIFDKGNWAVINGMYILTDCPKGYELVNSSERTSAGEFSHDNQICKQCLIGQYILDPNKHQCQACPIGAQCLQDLSCGLRNPPTFYCAGGRAIVGTWIANSSTGIYVLTECPPGYSLQSNSNSDQQCRACTQGQYIINPNSDICQNCPPGILPLIS